MVAKMYFEPLVEPHFHPDSYGYRPGKSALDAVGTARQRCWHQDWVSDLDIKGFFDSVPHTELMRCLARRIVDGAMLHLLKMWLEAPVDQIDERGTEGDQGGSPKQRTTRNKDEGRGTPQGAPITPPTMLHNRSRGAIGR
jgi:hypothetical protein